MIEFKSELIMNTSSNAVVMNNYLGLFKRLNRETKIHLVARLMNDIADEPEKTRSKKDVVNRFFGAFKSDKSAEEMIDEIRSSRKFNRVIETL